MTACSLTLLKFPIKETHGMSHFMFVNNIITNLNKSSKEDSMMKKLMAALLRDRNRSLKIEIYLFIS